jgi:hypothetical protein
MTNPYKRRFLFFWGTSMALLICVAMSSNVDWARPRFEEMLSKNLGRKVALGRLSWNFTFNGLAISTSRLEILDLDGHSPFLKAGHSEMGLAFSHLLQHELVLQHIVLFKPEIWTVRMSAERWNYSDLFDSFVTTKFINAYDGTVHVRDHSQLAHIIPSYDFQHVQLRFVNSRFRHAWPFFLSGELRHDNYTSTVSLSALGSGPNKDWKLNHYKFTVTGKKLNASDIASLIRFNTPVSGVIDLDATGSGSWDSGFTGVAYTNVGNLKFTGPEFIQLPDINTKLATQFSWNDGTINLNNETSHLFLSRNGSLEKPAYGGKLSVKQVALNQIISWLPVKWPFSRPSNSLPETSSSINGQLEVKPDHSVAVSGLTFSSGKSKISADGLLNAPTSGSNFKLSGQNVELADLGDAQLNLGLSTHNHSNTTSKLKLVGKVNFTASIKGNGFGQNAGVSFLDAALLNDSIKTKDLQLQNLTGSVQYENHCLTFHDLSGTVHGDNLKLNGTVQYGARHPNCNLDLSANKINLADLAAIFRLLNLDVPILQKGVLTGTTQDLDIKVRGSNIQVAFTPDLIHYLPAKAAHPADVSGGKILYSNDSIEMKSVDLLLKAGRLQISGVISGLDTDPTLEWCRFRTKNADVSELSSLLSGPFIPTSVRQDFKSYLSLVDLNSLHGKLSLNMALRKITKLNDYNVAGFISFGATSGRLNCFNSMEFSNFWGTVLASEQQLALQDLHGTAGVSPFHLSGTISNYRKPEASWQIDGDSFLALDDALHFLPSNIESKFKATGAFHFRTHLAGDKNNSTIIFSCHTNPSDHLSFSVPPLTLYSPPDKLRLEGSLIISSNSPDQTNHTAKNNIELKNCYLTVDKSVLCATGNYSWQNNEEPGLNFHVWSSEPLSAVTLLAILGHSDTSTSASTTQTPAQGTVYGSIEGNGTLSRLVCKAKSGFSDLTDPQYDLVDANGTVDAPHWIVLNLGRAGVQTIFGAPSSSAVLKFNQTGSDRLKLRSASVQLTSEDRNGHVWLALNNGLCSIFGGSVHFAGGLDSTDGTVHLGMDASNIDADMVVNTLLTRPHELSGQAALTAVFDSRGSSKQQLIGNLGGHGSFRINNGVVYRFGPLQERLSQFNLLRQGVFGFNLNNLLQTVVPVRNGQFKELSSSFDIQKGVVSFKDLRYNADDMRLWGTGVANLPTDSMQIEIAGRIPRVFPSMIGGPMGKVSRTMTLQNFFDVVTMHKLESLPSVPVLGDIANDRPRTFSFQITGPLDKPHSISQSIEKTFAWLPSMPNASAHPVPALSVP